MIMVLVQVNTGLLGLLGLERLLSGDEKIKNDYKKVKKWNSLLQIKTSKHLSYLKIGLILPKYS